MGDMPNPTVVPPPGQFAPAAGERPAFVPMPPGPVSYLSNSMDIVFTLFTDCGPSTTVRHAHGNTESLSFI